MFRRALEARTRGAAATAWQYGRATRPAKLGSVAIVAGRGGAELRVRERGLQVGRAVLAAGRDRACARQDVKLAADVRRHRLECPESRVDARDLVRQPRVEPVDSLIDPSNHPAGRPEERNNQSQNAACNRDAVTRRHHERAYQGRRARLDVARPAASRQRRPRGPRFRRPARRRPGAERPLPGGAARGRRDAGGGPSRTRRGQCERPRRRSRGKAPSGAPDGGRLPGTARGAGAGGAGRGRDGPRRRRPPAAPRLALPLCGFGGRLARLPIAALDTRLSTQIASAPAEVPNLETRLIRWMVVTVLATGGLTFGILRFPG